MIFPEGTRYNPDDGKRISKSREVARDSSMQVLDYHLTPRSRGAWLVMNTMGDKLEAIYDITVGYSGAECGKGSFDTDRNKVPQLKGENTQILMEPFWNRAIILFVYNVLYFYRFPSWALQISSHPREPHPHE